MPHPPRTAGGHFTGHAEVYPGMDLFEVPQLLPPILPFVLPTTADGPPFRGLPGTRAVPQRPMQSLEVRSSRMRGCSPAKPRLSRAEPVVCAQAPQPQRSFEPVPAPVPLGAPLRRHAPLPESPVAAPLAAALAAGPGLVASSCGNAAQAPLAPQPVSYTPPAVAPVQAAPPLSYTPPAIAQVQAAAPLSYTPPAIAQVPLSGQPLSYTPPVAQGPLQAQPLSYTPPATRAQTPLLPARTAEVGAPVPVPRAVSMPLAQAVVVNPKAGSPLPGSRPVSPEKLRVAQTPEPQRDRLAWGKGDTEDTPSPQPLGGPLARSSWQASLGFGNRTGTRGGGSVVEGPPPERLQATPSEPAACLARATSLTSVLPHTTQAVGAGVPTATPAASSSTTLGTASVAVSSSAVGSMNGHQPVSRTSPPPVTPTPSPTPPLTHTPPPLTPTPPMGSQKPPLPADPRPLGSASGLRPPTPPNRCCLQPQPQQTQPQPPLAACSSSSSTAPPQHSPALPADGARVPPLPLGVSNRLDLPAPNQEIAPVLPLAAASTSTAPLRPETDTRSPPPLGTLSFGSRLQGSSSPNGLERRWSLPPSSPELKSSGSALSGNSPDLQPAGRRMEGWRAPFKPDESRSADNHERRPSLPAGSIAGTLRLGGSDDPKPSASAGSCPDLKRVVGTQDQTGWKPLARFGSKEPLDSGLDAGSADRRHASSSSSLNHVAGTANSAPLAGLSAIPGTGSPKGLAALSRQQGADFKVGDTVSVDGRLGVVFWDGRPKHEYAMLRWKDDGSESGVKVSEIQQAPTTSTTTSAAAAASKSPPADHKAERHARGPPPGVSEWLTDDAVRESKGQFDAESPRLLFRNKSEVPDSWRTELDWK